MRFPPVYTLDELIRAGESSCFDFVFIDADKANYLNYYAAMIPISDGFTLVLKK